MNDKPIKFFLSKVNAGKNAYVWRLPCPPRRFIEHLGWAEDEPLEMKLTEKGLKIVPIEREATGAT